MVPELIRLIGWSHLLQPPLTLVLAGSGGVNLRAQLSASTPLAREVLANMAVASVLLPTTLGMLLACYPTLVLQPGPARALGGLISAFWCWRLYRQLFVLGPLWPRVPGRRSRLNMLLSLIFVVQGPALGLLVCSR